MGYRINMNQPGGCMALSIGDTHGSHGSWASKFGNPEKNRYPGSTGFPWLIIIFPIKKYHKISMWGHLPAVFGQYPWIYIDISQDYFL